MTVRKLDEYQDWAARTGGNEMSLEFAALGIAGEAGEVADYIKKVVYHGHELDRNKLAKELGDVLWYVAMLAKVADLKLSSVATLNVAKLKKRYPDGFTKERSQNRSDDE